MKALQVLQPGSFQVVNVPAPQLDPGVPEQILVRPNWVSMCGSDIPYFKGSKRHKNYPLPPGAPVHECVGRVVESTSAAFYPGDPVLAIPTNDQGLAELFVALSAKAVHLPLPVADSDTSCLIQPLSTVMNAVDHLGEITGRSVGVVGLGSIGLFFCWLLKQRGAGRVVGIDPNPQRCDLARRMGADQTFSLRSIEVVHAARQNPAAWEPVEICIEAVGHQMDTLNDCFELVQKSGAVLAFGVPDHLVYMLEFETFFRKNLNLLAVVTPNWSEYLPKARDLFISCRAELETLVTHRFPIQSAGDAFHLYASHQQGIVKAVIDLSSWNQKHK